MKYTMLFAALWLPVIVASQTTYHFVPNAGSWSDPVSWNPIRTLPQPNDIIVFSADAQVSGFRDVEAIGSLQITNSAKVVFNITQFAQLQMGLPLLPIPQLRCEPASSLDIAGPGGMQISLTAGCAGTIYGSLRFSGGPHRLEAMDSLAIQFENGASFVAASGFTGNAFGTTHLNTVVFKKGSAYYSQDGGNPFGAMAPTAVTIFREGSYYYQQQAIGLSLGGRTYGYLQTEANINLSLFGSANDLVIQNDFIVNQGNFIFHPNTIHSGSFKIFGDIVLNGSAFLDLGNANMQGAVQMLGNNPLIGSGAGTGTCTIQQLTISVSGAVSLMRPLRVNGTLQLTHGTINTSIGDLLTLGPSSMLLSPANLYGATNQGWELSFVNGPLELEIASAGTRIAPVGADGFFAPIKIEKVNAGPVTYQVEYFHQAFADVLSVNNPPLDHVSTTEYWRIQSIGAPTDDDAKLSFSWRPESWVATNVSERNDLMVAHYTDMGFGLKWNAEGSSPVIAGDGQYGFITTSNDVATFSNFTLSSRSAFNALPAKNLQWLAQEKNGIVEISWSNADFGAAEAFSIERKNNGREFRTLRSFSTRVVPNFYRVQDTLREDGIYYYRLLAKNGGAWQIISPVTGIRYQQPTTFDLYPNPCRDILNINLYTQSSTGELELVNSMGQLIRTLSVLGNFATLNTSWLNSGNYYIRFRKLNKVVTKAFSKL